jgi:methylenetetrahydrofolate reductase (NADPH)
MSVSPDLRVRAEVVRLVSEAHLEVIPLRGADEKVRAVPPGSIVTITCSPKFGLDRTLEHVASALQRGYEVIPHLAARQVSDRHELRQFVKQLDSLGVTTLYVIGGDGDPIGAYDEAAQILEDVRGFEHGLTRLGVGCYPEGHPSITDDQLLDALLRKQEVADYMVSQLCFDAGTNVEWLRRMRAAGVRLPLRVGLAAPLKVTKLIELSLKIGVGSSVRFLSKQQGFVSNLLLGRAYEPERLLLDMGEALLEPALGVEGVHLFTFNQIDVTVDWQASFVPTAEALGLNPPI